MTEQSFLNRLGSKKFIAFLIVMTQANVLMFFSIINDGVYQVVVTTVAVAYFGADVGAEYVRKQNNATGAIDPNEN